MTDEETKEWIRLSKNHSEHTNEERDEYQRLFALRMKSNWKKSAAIPRHADAIPMADCTLRHLYRIHSRNLTFGVYDGKKGFIGIRTKFGSRYLFTEYHWDQGPPYGTVNPKEDLGPMPDDIKCQESFDLEHETQRPIFHDGHEDEGGRGWAFVDTGKPLEEGHQPSFVSNSELFDWLDTFTPEVEETPWPPKPTSDKDT